MKSSRALAATLGLSVVAASLLLAAPAVAATSSDPDRSYVTADDISPDAGLTVDVPEGFSPASFPFPSTPVTMSAAGLSLPDRTALVYGYGADDHTDIAGSGLTVDFENNRDPLDGNLTFAVETADGAYLFVSSDGSALDHARSDAVWTLTEGSTTSPVETLEDIRADLVDRYPGAHVVRFAFQPSEARTISDLSFSGKVYIFTPEPVVTTAPTTLSASALVTVGTTITTSGFLPSEVVEQHLSGPDGSYVSGGQFTADADGVVTATYRAPGTVPAGDYELVLGSAGTRLQFFRFTVTADVVVAAPVDSTRSLAATGADATPPLGLAGALVALGLALTLAAVSRRSQPSA